VPACQRRKRCQLNIQTNVVFCKTLKPKRKGKFCFFNGGPGICNGKGACIAKP